MRPMRIAAVASITLATAVLAACGSTPPRPVMSQYDLSPAVAPAREVSLRSLEVLPASWLLSNGMHYRLAYVDANRREQFAGNRWTSPPAELIRVRLQQMLTTVRHRDQATCRLRIDLDDLVQVFDSPGSSRLVLDGRASLYGTQVSFIARRTVHVEQPAGSTALGGVEASGKLVSALAAELAEWVEQNCKSGDVSPAPLPAPEVPFGAKPSDKKR